MNVLHHTITWIVIIHTDQIVCDIVLFSTVFERFLPLEGDQEGVVWGCLQQKEAEEKQLEVANKQWLVITNWTEWVYWMFLSESLIKATDNDD